MKKHYVSLICFILAAYWFGIPANVRAEIVDYSTQSNWAYYQISPERDGDLFLICPTVDMGSDGNMNMSLADESTKAHFIGALNMERGLYDDVLTLYAPYYRQVTFSALTLSQAEAEPYIDLAYEDVREAFLYYVEHSGTRPFVLAGFSQGSEMALRLLKEFFDDPSFQNRLIAAYCIGWLITQDDLDSCPWLKPAQREDDIGVIVSFNTEAEWVTESRIVPSGVKTYAINPLNWKNDGTMARKEENMGACFTDYNGTIVEEIAALTGAYIDETRGTLKVPDIDSKEYSNDLFPVGVYHLYDYQFFYRNLQANVATRVAAFEATGKG